MELVPIDAGFYLDAPAAAAWTRSVAAGCPVTITTAYRTPEQQSAWRATYLRDLANWQAHGGTKPTYVAPVELSDHCKGLALDLKGPAIAWQRAHPDYGFVFTDATEVWHCAWRSWADLHQHDTPTPPSPVTVPVPVPVPLEDDDVSTYYEATTTDGFIFVGWAFEQGPDGTLRALSGPESVAHAQVHPAAWAARAKWSGTSLRVLALSAGLWEFTGDATSGPLAHTGRIIGRNAKSDGSQNYGADLRNYPRTVTA